MRQQSTVTVPSLLPIAQAYLVFMPFQQFDQCLVCVFGEWFGGPFIAPHLRCVDADKTNLVAGLQAYGITVVDITDIYSCINMGRGAMGLAKGERI